MVEEIMVEKSGVEARGPYFEHPLISPMILAPTGTRQARPGVADCSSITVGRQTVHTSPSTYILEAEAPFCSGEIENIFTN